MSYKYLAIFVLFIANVSIACASQAVEDEETGHFPKITVKNPIQTDQIKIDLENKEGFPKARTSELMVAKSDFARGMDRVLNDIEYAGKTLMARLIPICSSAAAVVSTIAMMPWFEKDTSITLQSIGTFLSVVASGAAFKKISDDKKRVAKVTAALNEQTQKTLATIAATD